MREMRYGRVWYQDTEETKIVKEEVEVIIRSLKLKKSNIRLHP